MPRVFGSIPGCGFKTLWICPNRSFWIYHPLCLPSRSYLSHRTPRPSLNLPFRPLCFRWYRPWNLPHFHSNPRLRVALPEPPHWNQSSRFTFPRYFAYSSTKLHFVTLFRVIATCLSSRSGASPGQPRHLIPLWVPVALPHTAFTHNGLSINVSE